MKNERRRTLNPSGIGSDAVHRLSEHWEDGRRAKKPTDQPEVLIQVGQIGNKDLPNGRHCPPDRITLSCPLVRRPFLQYRSYLPKS